MTTYDFDQIIDRKHTNCLKWIHYSEEILPMWVADMDFQSPAPVISALRESIDHGIFGYPEGFRNTADELCGLRDEIITRMEMLYEWSIEPEDIVFIPGVVTAFHLACHAFGTINDGALVQTPVYHPMLHAGATTGILSNEMILTECQNGAYEIDFDLFYQAVQNHTNLFLLCNPHNPVGKVFDRQELEKTAEICLKNNVLIVSDEIHCDLLFKGFKHIPIASLNQEVAMNTITLMSPSKTFNIAGLKCSFGIIQNPEIREKYLMASKGLVSSVNLLGYVAAEAAFRDGNEWLDQLLGYLETNRDYLHDFVDKKLPGIKMWRPQGTYLGWLDCRELQIDSSPYEFFLKKANVAFNQGSVFGSGGEGFVRINFGCPRGILKEALERMYASLN